LEQSFTACMPLLMATSTFTLNDMIIRWKINILLLLRYRKKSLLMPHASHQCLTHWTLV